VRAKAAVPVNGEPLVRRVISWLARHGCRDLVLNLHHHPASIAARVGDGSDMDVRVRYSWEQPVLGSAGGPRHALALLAEDDRMPFLIVNGDTLTDLDPRELLTTHAASGALITMALIPNPRPEKYGGVLVSDDGWVAGFTKPGDDRQSFHFIGVQAALAQAFSRLEDGVPANSVGGLYSHLLRENPHSIRAFVCTAAFADIGTAADCLATSLALAGREGDRMVSPGADVHRSAIVTRTAVWDDVRISSGVRLTDCIVTDGVSLLPGACYERCAIVPMGERTPAPGEQIADGLLIASF
jgi:NDP-sugar pyrophosphorylase family protein